MLHYLYNYSGEREIPADQETIKQYKIAKDGEHLPGTISKKFTDIVRELSLYRTEDGRKRSFYSLKHTYACRTFYKTNSIYKVMKRLGHSSISTTKIYSQFNESRLESDFHLTNKNSNNQKRETNQKRDKKQSGKSNNQDNSGYYQLNQQVVYNA